LKKNNGSKLKIIPLGGLEQIGMNITVFEYEDSIIVVDCGLAFPEDDMLGIDLVIPDVTYLKENIDKVKGFVITHGHEDHIGALPYILKEVNVPVYATKLTIGLIENKLKEHNLLRTTKRKIIKHGQSINLGAFRIEFIKTNHSIADAAALAIYSPAGIIVHTGDFKVDYTPVFGDVIDLQRFAEIGKKGVLALMCDSTNAERPGFTMSERTVGKTIDGLFAEHQNSRIIIATFASNVDRVQQIINSAYKYGRKVVIEGRSMVNIISIAQELGYAETKDPGDDVDGRDACRKIAILSSLVCGHQIYPQNIPTRGIRAITAADVSSAEKLGCVIKLIAWMKLGKDGSVAAGVEPCLVPKANQLASVDDVFNAVLVKGDMLGDVVFYGKGAGKLPTASAVVADVVDALKNGAQVHDSLFWQPADPVDGMLTDPAPAAYYVRVAGIAPPVVEAIYGYGKVVDERYEGCAYFVKRADERALAEAARKVEAVGGSVKLVLKRLPEEV